MTDAELKRHLGSRLLDVILHAQTAQAYVSGDLPDWSKVEECFRVIENDTTDGRAARTLLDLPPDEGF